MILSSMLMSKIEFIYLIKIDLKMHTVGTHGGRTLRFSIASKVYGSLNLKFNKI